jgi:hypothetical protein
MRQVGRARTVGDTELLPPRFVVGEEIFMTLWPVTCSTAQHIAERSGSHRSDPGSSLGSARTTSLGRDRQWCGRFVLHERAKCRCRQSRDRTEDASFVNAMASKGQPSRSDTASLAENGNARHSSSSRPKKCPTASWVRPRTPAPTCSFGGSSRSPGHAGGTTQARKFSCTFFHCTERAGVW